MKARHNMLKKLDDFFFDKDSTVLDKVWFYGAITFFVTIGMMTWAVVKL